jgi:hypothetical protein
MTPQDVDLANKLKEAHEAGRFERVHFDPGAVPKTSSLSECLANAEAYVAHHGGKVVGVWHAIMPTLFNRHFIVETDRGLFDVTRRNQGDNALSCMIRHEQICEMPIDQFAAQLQSDPS